MWYSKVPARPSVPRWTPSSDLPHRRGRVICDCQSASGCIPGSRSRTATGMWGWTCTAPLGSPRRRVLYYLAHEWCYSGDPEAADALAEQAALLAEKLNDPLRRGWCIHAQGLVARLRGQLGKAIERFTASRDLAHARGDEVFAANTETEIADCLICAGRLDEATQTMRRVAADALRISLSMLTINTTATGVHLCAALGAAEPAATLLGVHLAYWARLGSDLDPDLEEEWERRTGLINVRDALGEQKWEQALHVGSTLTLEEALTLLP